jgi:hypothetical protein
VAHWWLGPLHDLPKTLAITTLTLLAVIGAWRVVPRLDPPQRAVLLIPLLAYPAIYYLVAYMPRYRQPVDWIFYLLAGAAVWSRVGGAGSGSGPPR